MPEIQISVSNKIPVVVGDTKCIVADNSDYIVRFSFDGQWQDGEKTVYFVRDNGFAYPPVRTESDAVPVPRQESGGINKRLYIGVTQGESRTTRPAGINVLSSITDMIDDSAVQPDPSMWADILARVEALEENGGSAGEGGAVYVMEEGETLSDVPEEYDLAYDPYAEEDPEPENEYITQEQLEAAVEDALAEAKESGEFKGDPGDPGVTPHIGANGNWYIGETDTGVKAQGDPGEPGAKGDDYILTDDDKAEIAEQAAALVDTALLSAIGSGVIA